MPQNTPYFIATVTANKMNFAKSFFHSFRLVLTFATVAAFNTTSFAQPILDKLPPVPYPVENQHSEAKRILGKILFWEEQLSTDNTIACGSCHMPSAAGADKRNALAAGFDQQLNTQDDTLGSLGVIARNPLGEPIEHAIFKQGLQVTGRTAQPYFSGLWAKSNFWDGRAGSEFIDPDSQTIVIRSGGALENQALGPLMSTVEMAKTGQTAAEVTNKLSQAKPLALASNLPNDIAQTLSTKPNYPELFAQAFGDPTISLTRIAFAIATYERTLIADQTPWDMTMRKQQPLGFQENLGYEFFKQTGCAQCHQPPLFTDNKFYNIGIKNSNEDIGHELISTDKNDRGAMKTPSLRNIALKTTFMHTGQFNTLEDVIDAYADVPFKTFATKLPDGKDYNFQFTEQQRKAIMAFLTHALTDKRVKNETFPFDRPTLRSEIIAQHSPSPLTNVQISVNKDHNVEITWHETTQISHDFSSNQNLTDKFLTVSDVEIIRHDGRHYWATQSPFIDYFTEANNEYIYQLVKRNSQLEKSSPVTVNIKVAAKLYQTVQTIFLIIFFLTFVIVLRIIKKRKVPQPHTHST